MELYTNINLCSSASRWFCYKNISRRTVLWMSKTNRSLEQFYYHTFISRTVSCTKICADKMKTENEHNTDKASRQTERSFRNSLPLPAFMESNRHRDMSCAVPHFKCQLMVCYVLNNDHQGHKLCHTFIDALTYFSHSHVAVGMKVMRLAGQLV